MTADRPGTARLQVHLIGRFRLTRDGAAVPEHLIASKKGRTLLKMLAVNRGASVSVARIAEALWPETPPAQPDDNVATLVSRLRGVLGTAAIEGGRNAYTLVSGPHLEVDLEEAQRLTAEAEARLAGAEPTLARVAAERATQLLQDGQLLSEEPDAEWLDEMRDATLLLLRRARRCLWSSALALSDAVVALDAASAAVRTNILDEEAHRAVMTAHLTAGDQGAALAAFERLRATLEEELGTDPGPETEALHLAILRNEEPPPEPTAARAPATSVMDPGFVGRTEEVEALAQRWSQASAGSGALVLISGEAGIGKSRLAAEAAGMAAATGGLVLQARCYQAERSLFLQPIAEAIRAAVTTLSPDATRRAVGEWAGTLNELVPEIARVVTVADYEPGPPQVERRRTFEAVTAFFQQLARERAVLLSLDDLHLAGAATAELLHFMLRRLRHDRLLVIATMRSEEAPDFVDQLAGVAEVLSLGTLPDEAVHSLARQAQVAELSRELIEKTAGHTLFVVEALRSISESADAGSSIPIPDSLRNAVMARAKRLGVETEAFLRAVVVLGSNFDIEIGAHLAGVPVQVALQHAERALASRLIVQTETEYAFGNDLIREILYASTPRPSRIARHRLAASLVEGNPEAMAFHHAAAGDLTLAAAGWLAAAEAAAGSFANRDAVRLLGEAVSAASSSEDVVLMARCCLARSGVLEILGEYGDAFADATMALEIAQQHANADLEAEALERRAWVAYSSRYDEGADEFARRAAELGERAAAAERARPSAIMLTARLRHSRGDLDGATALLEDSLAGDLDDSTRAVALSCLGGALEHGDRFEEAARSLAEAIDLCRRTQNLRFLISALFFQGMAHGNLGRFARALATFDTLARLVEESESRSYWARVANLRSWIYRELGDIGRARDLAREAVDRAAEFGEIEPRGHAALALAECSLLDGDGDEAARLLEETNSMIGGRVVGFSWRLELRAVELGARLDPPQAENLLELARTHGSKKYEVLALAHLGRSDEAIALAARLGSDYLTALVGPHDMARAAVDRLTLELPEELRENFVARGRLSLAVSTAAPRARGRKASVRRRA